MSELKKHNSIIFLTTLSVYLGLVLVGGASSPVLAQAALTRNFDIQEEIEFKDDLDKKPEDEKLDFSKTLDDYFGEVGSFVKDLQKLYQLDNFDLDQDAFKVTELGLNPCAIQAHSGNYWSSYQTLPPYNSGLEPVITTAKSNFKNLDFLSDCKEKKSFQKGFAKNSNLIISYDKSELKIEYSFFKSDNQRAERLAGKFNQASKNYQSDEKNKIVSQTHKYTTIKSENNQVFLITNLPRASIDSLFANKDANPAASEK